MDILTIVLGLPPFILPIVFALLVLSILLTELRRPFSMFKHYRHYGVIGCILTLVCCVIYTLAFWNNLLNGPADVTNAPLGYLFLGFLFQGPYAGLGTVWLVLLGLAAMFMLPVVTADLKAFWTKKHADDTPAPTPSSEPESSQAPVTRNSRTQLYAGIMRHLSVPKPLTVEVEGKVAMFVATEPEVQDPKALAGHINKLLTAVPSFMVPVPVLVHDTVGSLINAERVRLINKKRDAEAMMFTSALYDLPQPLRDAIMNISLLPVVADTLRNQHFHVVASTGFGKSQLFQSLFIDDLDKDYAVVVIDSQNDLINTLATRVPPERLVLLDPEHCPPAINLFSFGTDQLALIEYMFSSQDAKLTSKQAMCFRYLSRYLISRSEGIGSLYFYLQSPEVFIDADAIAAMPSSDRTFFTEYVKPKGQYSETRQEILRRVLTLLENKTLEQMLTDQTPANGLNIARELEAGKVILINTAKAHMGNDGATLFGRFFMAQVMQAVMKGSRRRVHMYIDEFQDYAEDSPILEMLFTQSRKYNLGMVCAHQSLSQLPPKLRATMATNCAIKFAGGVSSQDRSDFARQMDVDEDFISRSKRGLFAAWFRDLGTAYYPVEFGRLEKQPEIAELSVIRDTMRKRYGPLPKEPKAESAPVRGKFTVADD